MYNPHTLWERSIGRLFDEFSLFNRLLRLGKTRVVKEYLGVGLYPRHNLNYAGREVKALAIHEMRSDAALILMGSNPLYPPVGSPSFIDLLLKLKDARKASIAKIWWHLPEAKGSKQTKAKIKNVIAAANTFGLGPIKNDDLTKIIETTFKV